MFTSWKRFRSCQAETAHCDRLYVDINAYNASGTVTDLAYTDLDGVIHDVWSTGEVTVLKSYDSIVAAYCEPTGMLFLFPRWNYSATTQQHLRKFCEKYGISWSVGMGRDAEKNTNFEHIIYCNSFDFPSTHDPSRPSGYAARW